MNRSLIHGWESTYLNSNRKQSDGKRSGLKKSEFHTALQDGDRHIAIAGMNGQWRSTGIEPPAQAVSGVAG